MNEKQAKEFVEILKQNGITVFSWHIDGYFRPVAKFNVPDYQENKTRKLLEKYLKDKSIV